MRVGRTTNGTAGVTRKGGRGAGGDKGFAPAGRAQGGAAAGVGGTGVLASIDALTALQGVDGADGADAAGAAAARGAAMLDDLEALRDELLTGDVDDGTLRRLRDRLGGRARGGLDAGLEAVLDDIEVRAAVELAKREPPADEAPGAAEAEPPPRADAPADAAARARRAYGSGGSRA
jgi:hypothetical protein